MATSMFGFLYEFETGKKRPALVVYRAEDVSEIIVFLSDVDSPIYDIDGRPSRTVRLYVDSSTLPGAAAEPDEVLSGGDS